jgi:hypothetical protein
MPLSADDIYGGRSGSTSSGRPNADAIYGGGTSGASGGNVTADDIYGGVQRTGSSAQPQGSLLDQWRNFDSPQGRAAFAGAIGGRLSPLGEALDYQLHGSLHAATGEADPNKQMKALRTQLGDEDAYERAPWPERGLYDFATQIRYDPLMYETAGFAPLARLGLRGLKALRPLQKEAAAASPKFVRTIGKDVSDIGQAVRHGFTRLLAPGGKDAGELENQRGRGARDILLGASGKHALNEQEMTRAFTARFEATIKGLEPEEETRVYQTLNGERGAQGLNPKEQAAFDGLRKLADESAFSEANKQLRYLISLRHGGLRGETRPFTNLVRYQKSPGEVEAPGLRGGTFFSRKTDPDYADEYNEAGMPWGGTNRVERVAAPKKPLDVGDWHDQAGLYALPKLFGSGRNKFRELTVIKNIKGPQGEAFKRRYLAAVGVPAGEAEKIAKSEGDELFYDRFAAELAKKQGYDAIQSSHEYFSLDPAAHAPGRRVFHAKPPELEPIDPALAPVDQHLIAEDKRMRGMSSPRLSQALYPLGRRVKKPLKPGEYELFRYQSEPGEAQFSPGSTSTFYSIGKPPEIGHGSYRSSAYIPNVGGAHLVTGKYSPKNPLELPVKNGSVGEAILTKFYGPEYARMIGSSAVRIARGEHLGGMNEAADQLAVELGIHPADREAGTFGQDVEQSPWEQSFSHETGATSSAMLDRLGAEAARQAGHDAVIMRRPKTHLTNEEPPGQFMRLYPEGKAPGEAKPPVSPDDELNAFLNEHASPDISKSGTITNPQEDEVLAKRRGGRLWRNVQRAKIEPMEVSPDIAEFVGPGGRRDAYRWRYLPGYNQLAGTPKQEAFEFNPLNWENPNLKERDDFKVDPEQHEQQRGAWRRMLANTARESSTASLRRELPERGLPITPNVEAALQRHVAAKGNERSGLQKGIDAYKGVLRYGRAAQVGLTPFHAANIAGLQLSHAPTTIPESVVTATRALLPGANRHEIFRKGRELGALGPSQERIPPFASAVLPLRLGIGGAAGGYAGYESDQNATPEERWKRAGLGALAGAAAGAGVRRWSRAMTNAVFTYDDAAKQALAGHYLTRHGMTKPYQAGRQAAEDLIDYGNPSELGNGLSWVSKFPTYRSQLPFSVARGIARHPARFAAVNRAGAGIPAGGEAQTPAGPVKSYSSISDVGRMASDMKGYARSTLGDPIKIVLSLAEKFSVIPKQQWGYYFTYKLDPTSKEVLINAAAAGMPEARSILDQTGVGMFKHNPTSSTLPLPIREGLFDVTGLSVGR